MTQATPQAGKVNFVELGARLRAYRMGRALTPEALAARLGISRAALYRAEKGEIAKIEMLTAIAEELRVSLPSLLGIGIEYVDNAVSFFERMRQIEEDCDQIIGLFSPISYLVTTAGYDRVLSDVMTEGTPQEEHEDVTQIIEILKKRKDRFAARRPLLASIVSDADIGRFLREGLVGRMDLPEETRAERRRMALREARNISALLRDPQIGLQVGVAREPIPSTSFQIVRSAAGSTLTISPFRLGHNPNTRIGVGLITSAPEALDLHEKITRRLWASSLKGREGADHVDALIAQHGIA
ncbi:helix-turn-helix transcriptional regulator [Pseudooceanicola sp. CBS1P-1]|uniref:Helix-turn-helix domain-containing protein n=1 Tax=Pseudooceanicola albus TaxID=2692189 RepID=A0A6L7G5S0_9RHOB|nr:MULTISPECIES: helix-turn-helix transcriptional regulator [Pseudooceanicola]MBT9385274.1 helix-turn-helix transcriptional regulator [Pseudooceanicola endophyticus]MXN18867.1 helix-turn-helix domain-containing protein [Pseudooceanicola albus]